MNRIYLVSIMVLLVTSGFILQQPLEPPAGRASFTTGENLKYKIHYGLINAAEAEIDIASDIQNINNRPCYRANVFGKTVGSFDFFLRIRDTWRSYIDTSSILPHKFHRNIEEGRYRKKENVLFDREKNIAFVNSKTNYTVAIPANVQDIVSAFYYLRSLNLDRYKPGDIIRVKGFFNKKVYDMQVIYKGRETIETKAGYFKAFKLVPKMPDSDLFAGENSVSIYLSDDKNRIPVMIKADLFMGGAVKVNLYKYSGLKYKLNLARN